MQGFGSAPSRNGFKAAGKSSEVKLGDIGNGSVGGKVASSDACKQCGHAPGSAIKGFSGSGVKGGKVKV